jgi:hypothetical protein
LGSLESGPIAAKPASRTLPMTPAGAVLRMAQPEGFAGPIIFRVGSKSALRMFCKACWPCGPLVNFGNGNDEY